MSPNDIGRVLRSSVHHTASAGVTTGIAINNYPNYNPPARWQETLIAYGTISMAVFINSYLGMLLPTVETLIFLVHTFGFLAVLIPVVYFGQHGPASYVFGHFINEGGWQTQGLSFLVGLPTTMVAFVGIDGAAHMAEEIAHAPVVIPRSMISSVAINGMLGFAMLLATMFCIGDADAILETPTCYPIIAIFSQALHSQGGTSTLSSILVAANTFSCIGLMAAASRAMWAFAREKALPGYQVLSRVEPRTRLPLYSIALTALIAFLLVLINIGSSVVLINIGSSVVLPAFLNLTLAGIFSAYFISASVMLHKRLTTPPAAIACGPFRLGRLDVPVTVFSLLYTLVGLFLSFWPETRRVTGSTMNWSAVVYVGAVAVSLVFWVFWGRKVYRGPIVEIATGLGSYM